MMLKNLDSNLLVTTPSDSFYLTLPTILQKLIIVCIHLYVPPSSINRSSTAQAHEINVRYATAAKGKNDRALFLQ
jgi:hypothetical protein